MNSEPVSLAPAPWPTNGWPTSTPEAQGMISDRLTDMLTAVREQKGAIHSALVVRDGWLVLDAYVNPFRAGERHEIYSCTKSILSALIGIAIDQGHLPGIDQQVLELFPARIVAHRDTHKESLTLEHLLTMAPGLHCQDSYLYDWRGIEELYAREDWVGYILDLPMAEPPGVRFEYCNGASFLLAAILQQATGATALAFAEQHLLAPLGITDVQWSANDRGINIGWGEMQMRPRDMAKIGHLYLNQGRWAGAQVVPAAWVQTSTRKHLAATLQDGYGFHWWVDDSGVYMALGYSGQFIFVVPAQRIVAVFTGNLSERDFFEPQRILNRYVIPAVVSDTPLPPDPDGLHRLEARLKELARR